MSGKTHQLPGLFHAFTQENRRIQEGKLLNVILVINMILPPYCQHYNPSMLTLCFHGQILKISATASSEGAPDVQGWGMGRYLARLRLQWVCCWEVTRQHNLALWTKISLAPCCFFVYPRVKIYFFIYFSFHRLAAGRMHVVHDSVSLPVLRPNGAANVAERKRRQQALVRGRGKKDFYWCEKFNQ